MKNKAIFKYNNGNSALLCSKCRTIIKTGKDYTKEELEASRGKKYMKPQYCIECIDKMIIKFPII